MAAFRSQPQRLLGALKLHAVVGWMQPEAVARRDTRHIRRVAYHVGGGRKRSRHLWRDERLVARPQPGDGQPARHSAAFMRSPCPCTSTIAKYGQSVSSISASRVTLP